MLVDESALAQQRLQYVQTMLVAFQPFSHTEPLLQPGEDWLSKGRACRLNPYNAMVVNNLQDYYASKSMAAAQLDARLAAEQVVDPDEVDDQFDPFADEHNVDSGNEDELNEEADRDMDEGVVEGGFITPELLQLYTDSPALFQSALQRGRDVAARLGNENLNNISAADARAWTAYFKTAALDPFADVEVCPELRPNQVRSVQQRATVVDWVTQSLASVNLEYASRASQAEQQDAQRPPPLLPPH
jgi:hypothetical protein